MFSFFRKKKITAKPKIDNGQLEIDKFKGFRGIGERFNYIGVEMIVTSHQKTEFTGVNYTNYAWLTCDYKNEIGDIKVISFAPYELNTLIAENT